MKDGIDLIVGLGNPGRQYEDTRHNAGAWFVERLAKQHNASLSADSKVPGRTARITLHGHELRLLVPTTFMNISGQAVAPFAHFFKIAPERILIVHDELDLPPGTAKLKQGGGHGGHNGLRDIISKLGNNANFGRLRIGIGHPGSADKVSGYVLGKAPATEQRMIDDAIGEAIAILPDLLSGHPNRAMNRLHSFAATA